MGRPPETDIVVRAKRGDPDAYEALMRMHEHIAFRTAYAIVGSAADAEEMTQEAFVKAYNALPRFRTGSPFRPRLLRIVANEAPIDLAGGASRTYASGFDTPVDVESSRNGTLYVADYGNNRIARVVDGRGVTVATGIGANGVAVGAGGTIYATERLLPRVRAINPATGAIRTIVGFP